MISSSFLRRQRKLREMDHFFHTRGISTGQEAMLKSHNWNTITLSVDLSLSVWQWSGVWKKRLCGWLLGAVSVSPRQQFDWKPFALTLFPLVPLTCAHTGYSVSLLSLTTYFCITGIKIIAGVLHYYLSHLHT